MTAPFHPPLNLTTIQLNSRVKGINMSHVVEVYDCGVAMLCCATSRCYYFRTQCYMVPYHR